MTEEVLKRILVDAILALPESPDYDKQAAVEALRNIKFTGAGPSGILLSAFSWADYPEIPWANIYNALASHESMHWSLSEGEQ